MAISELRAPAGQLPPPSNARAELGAAIGARAAEVAVEVLARMAPHLAGTGPVSDGYQSHRESRSIWATLLIARWLITGVAADDDEKHWLELGGTLAAAEGVPIAHSARGYVFWRTTLSRILREEAQRLDTPAAIAEEALAVIEASADSSTMRMARAYDAELRRINEQLRTANAFKSEFLAKMSHELRTPLSAIIGFSELLLEGIDGDLSEPQREDVGQIHRSGRSLLELINDVLDLSKIEAGRMTVAAAPVDLRAVVGDVLTTLRPIAAGKALALTSSLPEAAVVRGDSLRVRQVLTNLVGNALKFTAAGSVRVTGRIEGDCLRVEVADTGPGVPLEARERIFDEFRQADAHVSHTHGGTGLGLAISRKLVELQGGRLGVESEVGRGSRFWFTLPLEAAAASSPAPVAQVPAPVPGHPHVHGGDPHAWPGQTRDVILVIDDEPAMRDLLKRRLGEAGFATAEATCAAEAIALARDLHPAAITLDLMLAGENGWDVLARLRADPTTHDIPVVVVSVVGGHEMALELGAMGYVAKPVSKRELISTVRAALHSVRGARILCVDDDPDALAPLARVLTGAGAAVTVVDSAEAALAASADAPPDAMFVDLGLPNMSGFELVARLRARPALAQVPLIVLTGRGLDGEDRAALNGHVDRVIRKGDLTLDDLEATVRQALAHRRAPVPVGTA